jgi:hypothetical protein
VAKPFLNRLCVAAAARNPLGRGVDRRTVEIAGGRCCV